VEFEWDIAKEKSNLTKHGVSFKAAKLVFDDPYLITDVDDTIAYGEERERAIGMALDQLVTIIFTMRHGKCRIISARRATRNEQQDYYGQT
jgi:uncharacterized protein